ncbi:hypothetical protein K439DRAFT_1068446 [Ramaria rubella]|nr:hypothetical protein K439DRAFT_1068446 [Ramaria rubella]
MHSDGLTCIAEIKMSPIRLNCTASSELGNWNTLNERSDSIGVVCIGRLCERERVSALIRLRIRRRLNSLPPASGFRLALTLYTARKPWRSGSLYYRTAAANDTIQTLPGSQPPNQKSRIRTSGWQNVTGNLTVRVVYAQRQRDHTSFRTAFTQMQGSSFFRHKLRSRKLRNQ